MIRQEAEVVMDVKKIALLVGALVVAAITALMAKSMFSERGAAAPQAVAAIAETGPKILVATRPLPVGTIITADAFRFQPWPKELIQSAYFLEGTADLASLTGTVVRHAVTAGEPVTQGALVKPGDRGFMAAALGTGMRAITVPVSIQSGVAGFIFPGDRVDLVLTQEVAGGGDGPPLKAAETIISNLRVLATDQRTNSVNADGKTEVKPFASVTLEVTQRIAEKIAVAQTIGELTLSLRSIADNAAELEQAIASGAVNLPEGTDGKTERAVMTSLMSRPRDTSTSAMTGGEVSRYQRRTVPGKASAAMSARTEQPSMMPIASRPISFTDGSGSGGSVVRIARGNTVSPTPVGGN